MREARIQDRKGVSALSAAEMDDGERPLDAFLEPIQMTGLGEIQALAVERYHLSQRQDVLKGGKMVGIKRPVYKDLVAEVVRGEDKRIEKERLLEVARMEQEAADAQAAAIVAEMDAERTRAERKTKNEAHFKLQEEKRAQVGRHSGRQLQRGLTDVDGVQFVDDFEDGFDSDAGDERARVQQLSSAQTILSAEEEEKLLMTKAADGDGRQVRRMLRMGSMLHTDKKNLSALHQKRMDHADGKYRDSDSDDDDEDDDGDGDGDGRDRLHSRGGKAGLNRGIPGGGPPPRGYQSDKDLIILQKQERRNTMMAEKEAKTLEIIREKEDRIKRRAEAAAREHLIVSWLFITSLIARLQKMRVEVINVREEKKRWKNASQEKKAVRTIEMWWPDLYRLKKISRHPREMNNLAAGMRYLWAKIKIRKRHAGSNLIKQFIRDTTGMGETVKKIYAFRAKILLVQQSVREWFLIKQCRLRNLLVYWDKVEAIEREKMARAEEIMNMKSREAAEGIKGLGETLRKIDAVAASVGTLHEREAERTKWRAAQENGKGKGLAGQNVVMQQGMSLMKWMQAVRAHHPGGEEKLDTCVGLLVEGRKRHVVAQDASMMPTEDRKPLQLTIDDALLFLKTSNGEAAKGNRAMEALADVMEQSGGRRAAYYMHTGDGRMIFDQVPSDHSTLVTIISNTHPSSLVPHHPSPITHYLHP
jgi:hypothetical protein